MRELGLSILSLEFAVRHAALIALLLTCFTYDTFAQSALEKAERDELAVIPNNDPAMAAAIEKARATLSDFLALAKAPRPSTTGFSVKVGFLADDRKGHEFFWIRPFDSKGDRFTGQLRNSPRWIKRLKFGDTVTFAKRQIVDWTYLEDGKMKGNYTACAILTRESKESAEAFKKQYGLQCDL
jgi:uncharacterized protein YegJ (DUF2314 family)